MVVVEFSPGIDLSAIRYRATGVEMMSGDTPRSYSETITLQAPSPTKSASIEVLDGNGSVIGALNICGVAKTRNGFESDSHEVARGCHLSETQILLKQNWRRL
ncbi:MAG: hypothetical protein IPN20_00565 [Haliscomenobacter sp.]|nr:hypothetical protein [Haliscomenobacter sp.]